ncbi:DNA (cytosine-5-)-methyltransferase N-terminal subunit [Mycoplasma enhydrae]|uniref:DNA (cytosine-5-)-methyltransferase N-terminal subunit n=1 Tax=Mycoplasma enhydrae TaxID=2499220 RepID=UPI00280B22DD|nr:DNA (cytosine-5-)-methyltransferase [Mycoplasma enhydrae]
MKNVKLYEMFAGIGSQYKALKNIEKSLKINVKSLGSCDFYIDAIIAYMIIHYGAVSFEEKYSKTEMITKLKEYIWSANSKNVVSDNYFQKMNEQKLRRIFPYLYGYVNNDYFFKKFNVNERERERERESQTDITHFEKLPKDIDILTYSFPCQDISQQGKQKGLDNTRSGLLYEIERILKNNKNSLPKVLVLENVKALMSKKFIEQFKDWTKSLEKLGYKSKYKIINSIDYGSAQNRERVFCISWLDKTKNFDFPKHITHENTLDKIICNDNMEEFKYSNKYAFNEFKKTKNGIWKSKLIDYTNFNSEAYIYLNKGFGPTLTASGANSRLKFYFKETNSINYINAQQSFLYMGFDNKDYLALKNADLMSETKMIYLCGNSISVEVLEHVFKEIIECKLI